ncbi:hypothetical protein Tco_0590943 [Tanacetum coccineum]
MENVNPPPANNRPVLPAALHFDDGSEDTPLISPFPHSDNDSDDEEVLNELSEYENARTLRQERIINSFDGDDLAFECMVIFDEEKLGSS